MEPVEQVHRTFLTVQRASPLTIESSTGRTTFVNTLCGKKVLQAKDADDAGNAHLEEGVRIKPITVGEAEHSPFPHATCH